MGGGGGKVRGGLIPLPKNQVGGCSVGGSKCCGGRVAKGQTVGGLKVSKGEILGGELNGTFLQFEFRFKNRLCRTLALQSFHITHLINVEILAKFCTTRKTKKVKKNPF